MTRDYIYEEMTWSEISQALAYVTMYEAGERHFGKGVKNKLDAWLYRGRDNFADDLRKAVGEMRK
jgi:hypothetical protein